MENVPEKIAVLDRHNRISLNFPSLIVFQLPTKAFKIKQLSYQINNNIFAKLSPPFCCNFTNMHDSFWIISIDMENRSIYNLEKCNTVHYLPTIFMLLPHELRSPRQNSETNFCRHQRFCTHCTDISEREQIKASRF